ncbi:hypothetical protein LINPERHAP1_LOCUS17977, partial [Linum perenne]
MSMPLPRFPPIHRRLMHALMLHRRGFSRSGVGCHQPSLHLIGSECSGFLFRLFICTSAVDSGAMVRRWLIGGEALARRWLIGGEALARRWLIELRKKRTKRTTVKFLKKVQPFNLMYLIS